ncbi:unnamed protein product [Mycena citricolor]|uniref:Uncharacterized protein n=1 Tax=Mycena citricolor TaxID=2018698 RepID=A0AAD2K3H4_9AGAR|nr:unnamed protein product [Mycena citricolor]
MPVKCTQLSKLPKTARIASVDFHAKTPGHFALYIPAPRHKRLDPNHPAFNDTAKPSVIWAPSPTKAFGLGVLHKGLLLDSQHLFGKNVALDVPYDRTTTRIGGKEPVPIEPGGRLSMSLQMQSLSIFRVHERVKTYRRFKTAIGLIVTRGADGKMVDGKWNLVFNDKEVSEDWILAGSFLRAICDLRAYTDILDWTYYLRPTLEIYRMPYPELISLLRPMLRMLQIRATAMEQKWMQSKAPSRVKRNDFMPKSATSQSSSTPQTRQTPYTRQESLHALKSLGSNQERPMFDRRQTMSVRTEQLQGKAIVGTRTQFVSDARPSQPKATEPSRDHAEALFPSLKRFRLASKAVVTQHIPDIDKADVPPPPSQTFEGDLPEQPDFNPFASFSASTANKASPSLVEAVSVARTKEPESSDVPLHSVQSRARPISHLEPKASPHPKKVWLSFLLDSHGATDGSYQTPGWWNLSRSIKSENGAEFLKPSKARDDNPNPEKIGGFSISEQKRGPQNDLQARLSRMLYRDPVVPARKAKK